MIVARIRDGKKIVVTGSCKIERYIGQDQGWFPVESFNFGFTEDSNDEEKDPAAKGGPPKPAGSNPPGGGPKGQGGKRKEKDFAELSLEKQIDTATCSLMYLAMEERKSKRGVVKSQGGKARDLNADIHVLGLVQRGQSAEKSVYPIIMVHLEAVNILGWGIQGSGDNRPSENVKLRYDRAAIVYCATTDGQHFMMHGPRGWDQTTNQGFDSGKFTWKSDDFKSFLPTGTDLTNAG
jgi:hypothetical protein